MVSARFGRTVAAGRYAKQVAFAIVSIDVYFPLRTFGQFRPLAEDAISLEIPLRMDFATRGFPSAFFT
jgi:hypothetical protein